MNIFWLGALKLRAAVDVWFLLCKIWANILVRSHVQLSVATTHHADDITHSFYFV